MAKSKHPKRDQTVRLLRQGWITPLQSAMKGGAMALSQEAGRIERYYGVTLERKMVTNAKSKCMAYRWPKARLLPALVRFEEAEA